MSQNKLLTGLLVGAAMGVIVSLFDRNTRNDVMNKSKKVSENAKYYASNKDELKSAIQQQAGKAQNLYERFSDDASYVGDKVSELKELTPQVKDMAMETKEAFVDTKDAVVDSKEDVVSALKEDNPSASSSLTDDSNSNSGQNQGSSQGNNQGSNQSRGNSQDPEYGKKQ